jgi:hypothetical protein
MTMLVFNYTEGLKAWVIASNSWTVAESWKNKCTIHNFGLHGDDVLIHASMDEFLALIVEGGKIVDLRKLQEERCR